MTKKTDLGIKKVDARIDFFDPEVEKLPMRTFFLMRSTLKKPVMGCLLLRAAIFDPF